MLWVLYALIAAFTLATADMFTKKISSEVDDYVVIFMRHVFTLPLLLPFLFFIDIPSIDISFWYVVAIALPFEILAVIFYIKSIRSSPLSLVMPFLSLTPLFLLLTSFLILGEFPSLMGLAGILLISIGIYTLNIQHFKDGFFMPIKSILREKGCLYMVFAAFLFSILANLGKIIVQKSSPMFVSAVYFPVLVVPFAAIMLAKSRNIKSQIKGHTGIFFLVSLFSSLMIVFHMLAIQLVIVPYFISIKRTSALFGVIYGLLIFKETNIRERFAGALLMLIGAVMIILS